eukprot:935529_1
MSTVSRMRPGLKTSDFCNDVTITTYKLISITVHSTTKSHKAHSSPSNSASNTDATHLDSTSLASTFTSSCYCHSLWLYWWYPIATVEGTTTTMVHYTRNLYSFITTTHLILHIHRLLSATAESEGTAAVGGTGVAQYAGRILGGSGLLIVLYFTRLRNPLYVSMIGVSEAKLQLADGQASPQWNAMWDTHSANDSMKTRLTAMEQYLGEAMSATEPEQMNAIQIKVDAIREKGYSNAIKVAMGRADFWAESGRIVKFEQVLNTITQYVTEGGVLDDKELERVRAKAYGIHCGKLLANAQTCSNKGDVSNCQKQIADIRNVQYKMGGTFVEASKLEDVLQRAHQHHVSHMINEARKIKQNGSRKQAKNVMDQAKQYATLHNVEFDDNAASQVLS